MQAAAFVESDGELFVLINTDPLTVWHVNRSMSPGLATEWEYVGALCTNGRLRVALPAGDYIYFSGDFGTYAVPRGEEEERGCCPGV